MCWLLLFVWYSLFLLSLLDCFIDSVVCLCVYFGVSAKFAKYLMCVAVVVVGFVLFNSVLRLLLLLLFVLCLCDVLVVVL